MVYKIRHHFIHTAPLLLIAAVFGGVIRIVLALRNIADNAPSSRFSALVGDGIDEFSSRLGSAGATISSLTTDSNLWIGLTALLATTITVAASLRHLTDSIDGPGDAIAVARHAATRFAGVIGMRRAPVRWGSVYNAVTGHPIPYARVDVLDGHGKRTASTVADARGIYGFYLSAETLHSRGGIGTLVGTKDGYYGCPHQKSISSHFNFSDTDIPMVPISAAPTTGDHTSSVYMRGTLSVAFWAGVVTIPLTLLSLPTTTTTALTGLFGIAALVRALSITKRE